MKTTKLITAIIAIFGIAFLSTLESCSKESTNSSNSVSKSALLSKSGWVKTSVIMNSAEANPVIVDFDVYAMLEDSDKNDIINFKSDKSIVEVSDNSSTTNGKWALTDNDSKLTFTDSEGVSEMNLLALNSNELIVEVTEFDATLKADVNYTITFSH